MSLVNLVGNLSDLETTLFRCLGCGYFHPETAIHTTESLHGFRILEGDNPYSTPLNRLLRLASDLGLSLKKQDVDPGAVQLDLEQINAGLDGLCDEVAALAKRRQEVRESISMHEQALVQVHHLAGLNVSFDDIFACQYVKVRFGRLPYDSYSKLSYYDNKTFFFFPFDHDKDYYWGVYFAPATKIAVIDDIFTSLYFERIHVPDYVHGTPEAATANINAVLENERREMQEIQTKLDEIRVRSEAGLNTSYSLLKFASSAFGLRKYVATVHQRFYVVGFIPDAKKGEFDSLFADLPDVSCTDKPYDADPSLVPPVKLKNNRFAAPFEQFVQMYSLPSYKDIDPTAFFAVTYTLLFGIMFGDLGQGLLLALIGIVLWRWKKMNFGKILTRLGISSAIFGTLYGSVFGFEEWLDPIYESLGISFLPIKVFDNDVTNYLLLGAIAIGVTLIVCSIGINIYLGFRNKDYRRALFSNNGIAGLVFYLAAAFLVADMMMFQTGLCGSLYIVCLIVLPLLVIFFQEPLTKLLLRRKDLFPQGIGEFVVESFFELFEYVLSYLSNSMSFLRVGGFILSHAGMMAVVMSLADMVGAASPVVVILGNLFVMALEGLIVGIQVLRLEFYELFSRNFEGNGKPYEPAHVTYESET